MNFCGWFAIGGAALIISAFFYCVIEAYLYRDVPDFPPYKGTNSTGPGTSGCACKSHMPCKIPPNMLGGPN